MRFRHAALMLCSFLLLSAPALATVDDDAIDQAAREYDRLFQESREAGNRPGMADMGDYVDQAFSAIPLQQLTLDQVERVLDKVPVAVSTRTSRGLDQHLQQLAEAADAEGARAAILRLRTQSRIVKSAEKLPRMQAALAHPAIKEAVAKGHGGELFATAMELEPKDLDAVVEPLVSLQDSVRPNAPARFFNSAAAFMMSVAKPADPESARRFAPLREQLAKALDEKLRGNVEDKDRDRLEQALGRLNGAYARGELLNSEAPPIDFVWYENPANPDEKISSLDDLKGKVVVLDFWATWCGPCIASFPNVKALHNYYRGYDVVVLGVTSVQGYHVSPTGRVDTKGDPQKEMSLMSEFVEQKSMTWPVAFSKQSVFNPDYGVMGIPSMVIIDTKGIVRHVGLHPGGKLDEKTPLIDKLLAEAGLVLPAQLLEMKKPN
jgi:thiol-disulfide isomerase/thioredoxin